ncbi:hypothetical protein ABFA07_014549 [Porites harrisoni]
MAGHGSPKFNEPWMDELDGENCIQRTVSFAVQGALVGGFSGAAVSALKIPDPKPTPLILQSLIMMKNHSLLLGGAAGLFTLTTCTSAALREKDDPGNWALGGLASGALFGLRRSSWQVGCAMASALAVGGAIAKYTGAYKHPFRTDRVFL